MNAEDRAFVREAEATAVEAVWRWQAWAGLTDAQAAGMVALATDGHLRPADVDERFDALFGEDALIEADERGLWDYLREWIRLAAEAKTAARGATADWSRPRGAFERLRDFQGCLSDAMADMAMSGRDAR